MTNLNEHVVWNINVTRLFVLMYMIVSDINVWMLDAGRSV